MNAGEAVAIVSDVFARAGLTLGGRSRAAIGRFAKGKLEAGENEDTVRAWAQHFAERKVQGAAIKPSQAWDDVAGGDSPARMAGVPMDKETRAQRRHSGYEWLGDALTDRQQVVLATVQELTREGLSTAEIVERVLGPKPPEVDDAA